MEGKPELNTVTGHLEEFRTRIIISIIYLSLGVIIALVFTPEYIFKWILGPISKLDYAHVQVLGPTEKFAAYFKTAFFAGLVVSSPFMLHQGWLFVKPALYPHEQRFLLLLIPTSLIMFLLGAAFIYYILLPASLAFLLGFDLGVEIETAITLDRYFSFVIMFILAGGILFQIPLIAYFLARFGLISPDTLSSKRKYAILLSMILAAAITPTGDPINMMLLTAPIYILYEISIVVCRLAWKGRIKNKQPD
ncbi:MAG TPA: twin-arginine translocase subunit TatC [bacterium]